MSCKCLNSKEKKNRDYTVGSQEEAVAVKKVGFLVNHVKMITKEQNLEVIEMLLREPNKDVGRLVPLGKLTKGGKENDGMATHMKEESFLWL